MNEPTARVAIEPSFSSRQSTVWFISARSPEAGPAFLCFALGSGEEGVSRVFEEVAREARLKHRGADIATGYEDLGNESPIRVDLIPPGIDIFAGNQRAQMVSSACREWLSTLRRVDPIQPQPYRSLLAGRNDVERIPIANTQDLATEITADEILQGVLRSDTRRSSHDGQKQEQGSGHSMHGAVAECHGLRSCANTMSSSSYSIDS